MMLLNKNTGQIVRCSPGRMRIRRLQRRVKAWSDRINPFIERLGIDYRLVMITLTYSGVDDYKAGHIRDFMLRGKKMLGLALLAYAWVAELQRRGAVHYHVLLLVKKGTSIPKPDDSGWWVHGSTRIETAKTPYYILKYTGKEYQKAGSFPKGLRMFAVWISGDVLSKSERWMFGLSALPKWLVEDIWRDGAFCKPARRVPGGGWECGGDRYYSPWEVWHFD